MSSKGIEVFVDVLNWHARYAWRPQPCVFGVNG